MASGEAGSRERDGNVDLDIFELSPAVTGALTISPVQMFQV
jgi:hypothetical protein